MVHDSWSLHTCVCLALSMIHPYELLILAFSGGDIIDALLMCMLIHYAGQISGGKKDKDVQRMRQKMIGNLMVAVSVGLIPGAGAIVDNFFRCNTRNAGLLEALLEERELKKATRLPEIAREGTNSSRDDSPPALPRRRRATENNSAIELRNVSPPTRDGSADRHAEKANSSESQGARFFPRKATNGKTATQVEEPTQRHESRRRHGPNPKAPQGFF